MRFSKSDFALMRWSILAVCVSVLASVIVLYSSGEYAKKAQNDKLSAQNMLNDARNRLTTAYQDENNITIYANEYGALLENKIIGDDQRLDWMEGLEKIRQQNLVLNFHYNIAPQKKYGLQPSIESGNFDINYSEMKLQFDLLHEAQLLRFFEALRANIKGWYQLNGCTLQRNAVTPGSGENGEPQIKAECSGGWITLKNRNAPQ